MKSLKENLWLWGQKPAGYDGAGYNLPKGNKMTPTEGLEFFDIQNLCRVKLSSEASNSFLHDQWISENASKICLSLVGAGGEVPKVDIEDILTLAKSDERIISAVMDDFISKKRMKAFTPEVLGGYIDRLHNSLSRPLELWSVLYERDFDITPVERARMFDLTTFWIWFGDNLSNYEKHFNRIRDIVDGGRIMLGIYMYDFGNGCPLSDDSMRRQLEFVEKKYEEGLIEGAILCSNVIADIGLSAVDITRNWIIGLK
ncbi:MAG: hypothetical protein IJ459_04615 [Clostridia bacterium]|nr:hypothetical protein [Clostridia bacterium]